MTGHFHKKYFWNIICLLCGLFLIGLFAFLYFEDPYASGSVYSGITLGAIISLSGLSSLLLNWGAFFKVEDGFVRAKYHWFGKLQCSVEDIAFVAAQVNTLSILLKSGKRYVIMGIDNSFELSAALRKQIFALEQEDPQILRQQLDKLQAQRKKDLFWTVGGCVLMFVNIFIAAFLTDWKEMYDFNRLDWTLFAMMGVVELLTVIGTFYVAFRCGKPILPMQQLQYRIKGGMVATQPLPSGNARAVYTDENYNGRVIVYGFPNDAGVYYCVQEFVSAEVLKTVHTSDIYKSDEDLDAEELKKLIDISYRFL